MPTSLSILRVSLSDVFADPANARSHPDENIDAITASLRRFGQAEPIVVQKGTRRIIAGHGRVVAMKKLGWTEAEIIELDVDDLNATALGIALNRSAELAEWNEETLAKLLSELQASDAGLDGVGFNDAELQAMIDSIADTNQAEIEEDEAPEPAEVAVTKLGDLWILGDHLLLAGDSTNSADVDRVLAGEKAALVATDPPYLVDYTGERPNDSGKDWSQNYREIDIKDADGFFRAIFSNVVRVLAPNAAVYCWHAHKRAGDIQRIWRELGLLDHQQLVWIKPTPVFGRVYWHFRHEPCMMGWLQGSKPEHDGQHEFDSVWEIDWQGKSRSVGAEHPTSKPVEIFARPMRKHTKRGAVVFEPFSGSGSQLMAAEQLGRRCRAIEISPVFVDVAIRRWQSATNRSAILDGDGRSWDEVAAERTVS